MQESNTEQHLPGFFATTLAPVSARMKSPGQLQKIHKLSSLSQAPTAGCEVGTGLSKGLSQTQTVIGGLETWVRILGD